MISVSLSMILSCWLDPKWKTEHHSQKAQILSIMFIPPGSCYIPLKGFQSSIFIKQGGSSQSVVYCVTWMFLADSLLPKQLTREEESINGTLIYSVLLCLNCIICTNEQNILYSWQSDHIKRLIADITLGLCDTRNGKPSCFVEYVVFSMHCFIWKYESCLQLDVENVAVVSWFNLWLSHVLG